MINVLVTNTVCRIDGRLDYPIVQYLDDQLSYDVSGAFFSEKFKKGVWDGRRHLFSTATFSFPTGLLDKVVDLLKSTGLVVNINDMRKPITQNSPLTCKTAPWDWQEDILKDCLTKIRGIIRAPTGSGKSIVMTNLMARINNPHTIILVNKRDILYQLKRDVAADLSVELGQVGDGIVDIKPITLVMVQTLAAVYKIKLEGFDEKDTTKLGQKVFDIRTMVDATGCLMADEVHNMVAKTYYSLQKYFKNAYYKFGFSATPYRTDQADILLEAAFGPRISDKSCSELIEKGFLAKPKFYLVRIKHKRAPSTLDYAALYDQEITTNEDRNFAIVKLGTKFWKQGKRILIIVTMRRHGKLLEEMFGMVIGKENVRYVHGNTDTDVRMKTLEDLNLGNIRLVIATKIYSEGINVKNLEVLINTKAQESPVDFVQIIGRAMRKTPEKDRVCIIDMYDYGCRFFETHSKARLEVLKKEPAFELLEIDEADV